MHATSSIRALGSPPSCSDWQFTRQMCNVSTKYFITSNYLLFISIRIIEENKIMASRYI